MIQDSFTDAHAERIAFIEDEVGFGVYKCRALDCGNHFVVRDNYVAFKHAADNTFLTPGLSFLQFSVSIETSHLRAGAGATRRTVVTLARTQNKVLAVHSFDFRRREQLDVIYFLTVDASDALCS